MSSKTMAATSTKVSVFVPEKFCALTMLPRVTQVIPLLRGTHRVIQLSVRLLQLIARRVDFRHCRADGAAGDLVYGLHGVIDG